MAPWNVAEERRRIKRQMMIWAVQRLDNAMNRIRTSMTGERAVIKREIDAYRAAATPEQRRLGERTMRPAVEALLGGFEQALSKKKEAMKGALAEHERALDRTLDALVLRQPMTDAEMRSFFDRQVAPAVDRWADAEEADARAGVAELRRKLRELHNKRA